MWNTEKKEITEKNLKVREKVEVVQLKKETVVSQVDKIGILRLVVVSDKWTVHFD